ncbi:MAG: type II toxin-antitoxin system RelE/ParE family toxin [Gallionellaceae bacterium]
MARHLRGEICRSGIYPKGYKNLQAGVLHAFQKKTQQTRKEDIALATTRYKQLKEIAK